MADTRPSDALPALWCGNGPHRSRSGERLEARSVLDLPGMRPPLLDHVSPSDDRLCDSAANRRQGPLFPWRHVRNSGSYIVPAEGIILDHILETTAGGHCLTPAALRKFNNALSKTSWGQTHQHRMALMDRSDVLASAQRYDLMGMLDQCPVRICGSARCLATRRSATAVMRGCSCRAILQALIAREPAERRPMIHAWLPPGFVPPQVTVVSVKPSAEVMMRGLGPTVRAGTVEQRRRVVLAERHTLTSQWASPFLLTEMVPHSGI